MKKQLKKILNIPCYKALSLFILLVFTVFISSCSQQRPKPRDPLIGKIYEANSEKMVSEEDLMKKIIPADIIYLGEKHDNPTHHAIQLRVLIKLVREGKRPSLGLELFPIDDTGFLMSYVFDKNKHYKLLSPQQKENILRKQLGWQNQKDSKWQFYFALIQTAKKYQLPVFGADLPRSITSRISSNGLKALNAVEKSLIPQSGFADQKYQKMMFQQFTESHCGWSNPEQLNRLYETWLARNDTMASSITAMKKDNPQGPVLMIVGAGHTAYNLGVYERVQAINKDLKQVNIGLTEISPTPATLAEYLKPGEEAVRPGGPAFDYIWFTPRANYDDPCLKFKKILQQAKQK